MNGTEFDSFRGYGVRIKLKEDCNFLKVKETLTRIGIANNKDKTLYQSCHILHKRGEYAIIHFKELYCLDKETSFKEGNFYDDVLHEDIARRNKIVDMFVQWGLVDLYEEDGELEVDKNIIDRIRIIKFSEKDQWKLVPKYKIGKFKKKNA